jgi:hypothetical protein
MISAAHRALLFFALTSALSLPSAQARFTCEGLLSLKYRFHYEICDHPKLPERARSAIFTSLGTVTKLFSGIREVFTKSASEMLSATGARTIIELGSGGGQGLTELSKGLGPDHPDIRYVATDLVPQVESWRHEFRGVREIDFVETSVSFQRFSEELDDVALKGNILAVVSAFHHVTNAEARAFFETASARGAHVLIIEPLERDYKSLLLSLGATGPALLSPFLAKKLGWRQRLELAVFNWLIPIVPAAFVHDGVVSTLRQRTADEWREILRGLPVHVEFERGLGPFRNFTVLKVFAR